MAWKLSLPQILVANIATFFSTIPERRTEPDGADVSSYQGMIDWDKYINHPWSPQFATTRCTLGTARVDTYWQRNAVEVRAREKPRNDYMVLIPGVPGRDQIKHYADTAAAHPAQGPLEIDFELHSNQAPSVLCNLWYEAYDEAHRYFDTITYSAKWFLDTYVTAAGVPGFMSEMRFHLAQYLTARYEHPGPVALPRGVNVDQVVMHQTSDRMYGKDFGMQSEEMDYNRILVGSLTDWFKPFGYVKKSPRQLNPTPIPIEGSLTLRAIRNVNARTEPNTSASVVELLTAGTDVEVENVAGASAWVKTTRNGQPVYVAAEHNGVRYLEPVE